MAQLKKSCSSLLSTVYANAGNAAKYGSASECSTLTTGLGSMLNGQTIPDGCCSDGRAFITAGCACSADVVTLVDSLRILPAGTDTAMAISGECEVAVEEAVAGTRVGARARAPSPRALVLL